MSAHDRPDPDDAREQAGAGDPQTARLRWIARGIVAAIGLWFVADGLSGVWSGGETLARVLVVVAVVLGVALAVLGLVYLARRGREG